MGEQTETFEGWAILELMGHRRLGGYVRQVAMFGADMIRIDVPAPDGAMQTQLYNGSALYCLTPTTEELARAVALRNQPQPVHRYELPAPTVTAQPSVDYSFEDDIYAEREAHDDD